MPRRLTQTAPGTAKSLRNHSFEMLVATWLMQDGWQVFVPLLDHGHCTDLLISDGPNYHRLQIKTLESQNEELEIHNRWKNTDVDYVAFFAKNSNWGYVIKAFKQNRTKLNAPDHQRFQQNKKDFLKAFHLA